MSVREPIQRQPQKTTSETVFECERSMAIGKRNISFEDVCGMDEVKADLNLAVVTPMRFPQIFTGRMRPYKGFLLFGATGTGKTHIAAALAREAVGVNFLYVSPTDLLSTHVGESKNKVRQLFEMARKETRSIIFIKDIDLLASTRIKDDDIRDAKTELILQLGSVSGITDGIFFMASTRRPQDLDPALLRWFDKLIYVSLPGKPQRLQIIKKELSAIESVELSEDNYKTLSEKTEGFSQADISRTCNSAKFSSILRNVENSPVHNGAVAREYCTPISTFNDVLQAIQEAHTSVDSEEIKKVEQFAEQNGVPVSEHHVEPRETETFFESFCLLCCDFFATIFI